MNRPLVYFAVSLFLGCLSSLMFTDNSLKGAAVILAASFLVIIFFTLEKKIFLIFIIFFFLLGITSYNLYFNVNDNIDCAKIRITEIKKFESVGSYNGKDVLLNGDLKNIQEGRNIIAYGKLRPEKDYSKGIVGKFYINKIKVANKDFIFYIYDIKRNIYNKFLNYLGSSKSAVVMALCFGDTRNLTLEQKNQFQQLGIIHAVSVSGLHIVLIFQIIESFLGIEAASIISFLYIIFTGMQSSTLRSFIMILIFKISKKFYKKYDSISSLSLSVMIILCYKPCYVANLGFALTVLATLGIILFYKRVQKALYFLPKKINEALSTTLSAQVFSMPYVAMTLGNISWGFIIGNIFLLEIISGVVVVGNIGLLFMNITPLFRFINFLLYNLLIALEGANFILLRICPPVVSTNYFEAIALLSVFMCYVFIKHGYSKCKFIPGIILIMLLTEHYYFFPQIQFLNSGKGDNILIKYKAETILLSNSENKNLTKSELYQKFNADKIVSDFQKGCIIKFNKDLTVEVPPNYGKSYNSLELDLHLRDKKIIFTRNYKGQRNFENNCDIIRIPKKKYFGDSNSLVLSDKDFVMYKVIFKKVYSLN